MRTRSFWKSAERRWLDRRNRVDGVRLLHRSAAKIETTSGECGPRRSKLCGSKVQNYRIGAACSVSVCVDPSASSPIRVPYGAAACRSSSEPPSRQRADMDRWRSRRVRGSPVECWTDTDAGERLSAGDAMRVTGRSWRNASVIAALYRQFGSIPE